MSVYVPEADPLQQQYALLGRLMASWSNLVVTIEEGIRRIEHNRNVGPKATPDRKVMQRLDYLTALLVQIQPDLVQIKFIQKNRGRLQEIKNLRDALAHGFVMGGSGADGNPAVLASIEVKGRPERYARTMAQMCVEIALLADFSTSIAAASGYVAYSGNPARKRSG